MQFMLVSFDVNRRTTMDKATNWAILIFHVDLFFSLISFRAYRDNGIVNKCCRLINFSPTRPSTNIYSVNPNIVRPPIRKYEEKSIAQTINGIIKIFNWLARIVPFLSKIPIPMRRSPK